MFDGVGRRRDTSSGQLVSIGENSLNGNERNCLFRNNGDGSFIDVGYVNEADLKEDGRGVALLDYNSDGNIDIVVRNYLQPAHMLQNLGGSGHWLRVKLVGTKSNRDAVGARVSVRTGETTQLREVHGGSGYLSSSSLVQHFGLGSHTAVDSLDVLWPSGERSRLVDLPVGQLVTIVEGRSQ